nr:hypothetical protein [Tanacetum cinerariifolium]
YEGNEFIGELIRITPIGRRKWVDRKIKHERSIKRRIRMSSGTSTTDLFYMIVMESFIFRKRKIRRSSGTATTNLFDIKAESFKPSKELSKVLVSSKREVREVEEDLVL